MLKYSFSTREKALLAIFAVIVLALLWYIFIFQNIDNQVKKIEGEIATAQETLTIDNAKLTQKKQMEDAIARYVASGARITEVPKYDNIQNVMNQLNVVLAGTANYSMTFDQIEPGNSNTIERGVTLTFGCGSYTEAVDILTSLARGQYPCRINDCSISDNTTSTSRTGNIGTGNANYSVTAHLIYIESTK